MLLTINIEPEQWLLLISCFEMHGALLHELPFELLSTLFLIPECELSLSLLLSYVFELNRLLLLTKIFEISSILLLNSLFETLQVLVTIIPV